uniref:Arminin 3b n=1 Tax=Hydra vulgaris TaxID=6087 RepID=ARM3B_HYDVU|nr:arminin 3b [Hydra vulgaris]
MKIVFAILFLTFIALTYARSFEDLKEEIKNEIEKEIFDDLEEESDELDNNVKKFNDAKPWRRWFRWKNIAPLIPVVIAASGKK